MRALRLEEARKLVAVDIDPPQPDGDKVIIKVSRVGICGSDLHYWNEENCIGIILGHEVMGTVVDPGSRIDLKIGDRVTALPINPCMKCPSCQRGYYHICIQTLAGSPGTSVYNPGACAEYAAYRPDMVRKLPDSISDEEAAMIEPGAVALRAVRDAGVKPGDKVLISGAGVIGLLCAMFARKAGASYIAITETNPHRIEKARQYGDAHQVFDVFDPNFLLGLLEASSPGFDIFIDCSGVGPAIDTGVSLLKTGGGVVELVGLNMEPVPVSLMFMVMKEPIIRPIVFYYQEEFDLCLKMIANKEIDIARFITRTCTLEETQAAYEDLTSGKSTDVKVMIAL